ncbi:MAG: acyl carrier protein [Succinatimonas sp.]|uniref:acyl carrier protein n=1 Tax=Succinivibrio sp. TaxID=2053619 RepID=UPI00402B037A|nr:acyl carrier protein [Succinatimonas sp.]
MTNKEKYINCFVEALEVPADKVEKLEYQGVESWDSVGHMSLVAAIEDAFDIMMDTDDIVDLSSFAKGIEILKKYDIEI